MNTRKTMALLTSALLAAFAITTIALATEDEWVQMSEKIDPVNPSSKLCMYSCQGVTVIAGGCDASKNCCGFYNCRTGQATNVECCPPSLACEFYYFLGVPSARCALQP